jgi:hypothetical protein
MANKDMRTAEVPYSIPKIAGAILVLIIIIAGAVYLVLPKAVDCGNDKSCFIINANECKSAVLREDIAAGTTVKYSAKACVLSKSIETFSIAEPEEVVSFFQGKQMTCAYTQNNFDSTLLDGLSTGMENCEGDLKDAITELRLAQLSLQTP